MKYTMRVFGTNVDGTLSNGWHTTPCLRVSLVPFRSYVLVMKGHGGGWYTRVHEGKTTLKFMDRHAFLVV